MAGGQRIDSHANWTGAAPKGEVFARGPSKVKQEMHADGFGALNNYEDTNEEIVRQQKMNSQKVASHPRKPLHRN